MTKTSKPRFVYVTYISTTPEKLWKALTDPEMTKQYWGRHRNASDWKVGSRWSHEDYDDPKLVDIVGKVLESDPPRRLVLTWEGAAEGLRDEKPSRVTFLIEPYMDAVRLTVTHDDLEPDSKMLHGVTAGWPAVLSALKTLLETGKPMPMSTRRMTKPPA
jgi:uncharacterized protein YndB with AHSA1/START domain